MLVLSLTKQGYLVIADGLIKITVTEIRGNKVSIGIEAPKDIGIYRDAVWERRQEAEARDKEQAQLEIGRLDGR